MKPPVKRALPWCAGALLVLLILALLFPVAPSSRNGGRQSDTLTLIMGFRAACRSYLTEYHSYPSGSLKEMITVLTGRNPRHIVFMALAEGQFNQAGELIDAWKTPFRLIQASEEQPPELLSAGSDKTFGTRDDLTFHRIALP